MKYLLDSVILIDHFNGIGAASAFLAGHGDACSVSVITRAEVLAGFTLRTEPLARNLLDHFDTLPIDIETADMAAAMRRTRRFKMPDALQAALAVRHGLVLVTRNTRDFRTGGKLKVLVPYKT